MQVRSYDIVTGDLKPENRLNEKRKNFGLAVIDYEYPITLYVLGGSDGKTPNNSVEK